MLKIPLINAAANPHSAAQPTFPLANKSGNFKTPAPNTAGVDNKNEKRAALARDNEARRPAVIVIPDLDTPGIIAIA